MIRKWKIIACNWCKNIAPMQRESDPHGSWFEPPLGWKTIDKNIHYCPVCCAAIDKARREGRATIGFVPEKGD